MAHSEHEHSGHTHGHDHGHSHDVTVKKVDRLSGTKVRLTIEFTSDNVRDHEIMIANNYLRSARIPGFRPGKAPMKMIRERFKDEIQTDLVKHLLEAGIHEAVEKTKLIPITQPKVKLEPLTEGKSFGFEAEYEVEPEVELKSYKGVPVKKPLILVPNEEVTKAIEGLRERFSSLEPFESINPEKGDYGVIEVSFQTTDGKNSLEKKNYTVELGADKLLPALERALLELKVGESKEVNETFPADYNDKSLAGKEAVFQCKLLELKKKVLPAIDDAFAEQLREGLTLAKLKEEIETDLKSGKEEEARQAQRQEVMDFLIKNNPFEVPQSMIEEQAVSLLHNVQEDLKRRGINPPPLKDEEAVTLHQRAEKLVRSSLLLRAVAVKEELKLDEQRLNARIDVIATQLNQSVDDAKKYLNGKGLMNRVRDEILTDQVFEYLLSQARVS